MTGAVRAIRRRRRDYTIPSVAAAMRILRWLVDRGGTLSQISTALSLSKSTTYGLLKTLQEGFVAYDGVTKRYHLGVDLLGLGEAAARQLDYVASVRPMLRSLVEETNLTGIIAQRINDHLVVVHKEEGRSEIRATMSLGQVVPAGVGAMGKTFTAFADAEGDSPHDRWGGFTANGAAKTPKSTASLEEIRRRGYATSLEEYRLGVNAVAAPVFDHRGRLALVLCLIGFAASMSSGTIGPLGERLKGRCAEASRVLGHTIAMQAAGTTGDRAARSSRRARSVSARSA